MVDGAQLPWQVADQPALCARPIVHVSLRQSPRIDTGRGETVETTRDTAAEIAPPVAAAVTRAPRCGSHTNMALSYI